MAEPRGIRRYISILLDRASANRAEAEAQRSLDRATDPRRANRNLREVDGGFDRLAAGARRLGGVLAGVFALGRIRDFVAGSLREFSQAEAIWNRLGQTVESTGTNFAKARVEIERAADSMRRRTTIGDEEFANVLKILIDLSGDYSASLRNVQLVADLSARKQLDLNTAAMLVGKVMTGNTTILKRHGITVDENSDAIEVLRERFRGAAENELETSAGKVKQLTNFWNDLREGIGEAIATSPGVSQFLNGIYDDSMHAADGLDRLIDRMGAWIDTWMDAGAVIRELNISGDSWGDVWRLLNMDPGDVRRAERTVQQRHLGRREALRSVERMTTVPQLQAELTRRRAELAALPNASELAHGINELIAAIVARINRLQETPRRTARPTGGETGGDHSREETATQRAARIQREREAATAHLIYMEELERQRSRAQVTPGTVPEGAIRGGARADALLATAEKQQAYAQHVADTWRNSYAEIENAAQGAAQNIMAVWSDAFAQLIFEGATLNQFIGGVFRGMAQAAIAGVADLARTKVAENIARAFEMFAMSFGRIAILDPVGASAARRAGVGHLVAAGKWGAFGALAGAAGGALGGGGGGGNVGQSRAGERTTESAERGRSEIHIYVDGVDPSNPRHQELTRSALERARQRYGQNAGVTYHSRTR